MKLSTMIFILTSTVMGYAKASQPAYLSPLAITKDVHLLYGNVGVVIGEKYVVLIDSWLGFYQEGSNQAVLEQVKQLTYKPILYVINTHSHEDHSGGNGYFANNGATIITHENAIYSPYIAKSGQPPYLMRFEKSLSLDLGNETLSAEHLIAHTFDDVFIYLKKQNLLFVGDNFTANKWVGLGQNGLKSFQAWTEKAISMMDENTLLVPAHGIHILTKSELEQHVKNVQSFVEHGRKLYMSGSNAEQIRLDKTMLDNVQRLIWDDFAKPFELSVFDVKHLITTEYQPNYQTSLTELKSYVGVYQLKSHSPIIVELNQSGQLTAKQQSKFFTFLKPIDASRFALMALLNDEQFEFVRNQQGSISALKALVSSASNYKSLTDTTWTRR